MSVEYKIEQYNSSGAKTATITDHLYLSYTKPVNGPGTYKYALPENHRSISLLDLDSQIEIWRRNQALGVDWYCDYYGFWRDYDWETDDQGKTRFVAMGPGQMHLLSRRHILFYTETNNKSSFDSVDGETVMHTLVKYNATSDATTGNGRLRNGAITGVSVATDQSRGNTVSWDCAYKNLLGELQKLSEVAGGDFDLVKVGAQAWEWRFYPGQLGTDRSASVTFSRGLGNMGLPRLKVRRTQEATVALAGGQGTTSSRNYAIRTGATYSASNDIETFVDARNGITSTALQALADERLAATEPQIVLTFEVLQTPGSYYGKHYFLGDLVTANYQDIEGTFKIGEVTVAYESGAEKLKVGLDAY